MGAAENNRRLSEVGRSASRTAWSTRRIAGLDRYLQSTTCEPSGIGPDRFDEAGVRVLPE
jgi:hypothetical protein